MLEVAGVRDSVAVAGLWVFLAWKVVRCGRRGRGLVWAKHALNVAGRQFRAYLVRVAFAAKVCCSLPWPQTLLSCHDTLMIVLIRHPYMCKIITYSLPWPQTLLSCHDTLMMVLIRHPYMYKIKTYSLPWPQTPFPGVWLSRHSDDGTNQAPLYVQEQNMRLNRSVIAPTLQRRAAMAAVPVTEL